MADISKITLPNGTTYDIKDAWARENLLKPLVLEVVTQLPTADASHMGVIYLKQHQHDPSALDPSAGDSYDEYVVVRSGTDPNYTYSWERIGNTDINLDSYTKLGHTHNVDVSIARHSYTPQGSVTGTFASSSVTASGSYTPTGAVSTATTENKTATVSKASSGTATYTPEGTVDASFNNISISVSGSYTPTGTVVTSTNTNKTVEVSPTTGTATYTPAGTVSATFSGSTATINVSGSVSGDISGSTGTDGEHTHKMHGTTKYFHPVNVPTAYGTTKFVTGVTTSKLDTTTVTGVSGSTTASKIVTSNKTNVAIASTGNTSVSYVTSTAGAVTLNKSTVNAVTSVKVDTTTGVTSATEDSVMWNATVSGETLTFTLKNLSAPTSATTNVTSATTDAHKVTITTVGTKLNSSTTTITQVSTNTDITVPIASTGATTVATGSVSSNGGGSTVAIGKSGDASAYTSVSTSTASFTYNATADGGSAVISALDACTGAAGTHDHRISLSLSSGAFSGSGSYTPQGTINASFDGSAARLTGSVSVPDTYTFTGNSSTITASGTASGTVSAKFTGTGARLVTGNIPVPKTYTFTGDSSTISVEGTAAGGNISATFSGSTATLTHTIYGASTGYKRIKSSSANGQDS